MAPTKKKANITTKKSVVKQGEDRVIKRPARGFHRFRSGVLNVTPKGGEKELVKNNQNSPLLRLPPELRSRIWDYALGGKVLRSGVLGRMVPTATERMHGMDLLRTCRQIYAETALLPYKLSTFSFGYPDYITSGLKYLKPFQRAQIVHLELSITTATAEYSLMYSRHWGFLPLGDKYNLDFLPGLKHIHVLLFRAVTPAEPDIDSCKMNVSKQLDKLIAGRDMDITIEVPGMLYMEYQRKWM